MRRPPSAALLDVAISGHRFPVIYCPSTIPLGVAGVSVASVDGWTS